MVRRVKFQQVASWSTRIGGDPKGTLVAEEGSKIHAAYVPAGGSRFRKQHDIRLTRTLIDIKVSTLDTGGALSVAEITSLHKGGPARHLHHEQDEWFYIVEGRYVIEVGEERYELGPGDSLLGPRKVAHAWGHVGEGTGRLIAALQPAGEIEAFFEDLAKLGSTPEREELQRVFSSNGLELAGPPLSIE
ncbi:MAG TPA: cupin domain-containing protein [Rubrobacter sp.]|nr:cupin domain-containing protein [Rubrobacter sp.]